MNINDSRHHWYTDEELIEFLNDPATHVDRDIPEHWDQFAEAAASESPPPSLNFKELYNDQVQQTRENLLRAFDLITNYKKELRAARKEIKDPKSLEELEWKLARELNKKVMDSIDNSLKSRFFELDFEIETDPQRVFSSHGPWLTVSPPYGNYYTTFLQLITDPDVGIDKLFRCEECPRVGIATYKRPQRFCSDKCRARFHIRQNAPKMKQYMREWRKKNPRMG